MQGLNTPDILIPFALGLLIPFVSRYVKNTDLQTLLNLFLSAGVAAIPIIPQGLDWKAYLVAFASAWLATLRADATTLPARIYSKRVAPGRHERLDEDPTLG